VSSFGERLSTAFQTHGQLCVGIDPSAEQLSSWGLADSASGVLDFSKAILDAAQDQAGIIKPQVAFFEQYGAPGLQVLSEILEDAHSRGFVVIADAKRGDIGSTMDGYTRAWLSNEAAFVADALTLSPFLGISSLQPTIDEAVANGKGVFLLAATSNPEAAEVQGAIRNGKTIAGQVVSYVAQQNNQTIGSVGVVIGATVNLDEVGIEAGHLSNTPVLMPGFGAQGVELSKAQELFGSISKNLICSVSRLVAGSEQLGLKARVQSAKQELEIGLRS
jgi:orotidine-5'-phosphate decarboxylase